MGSLFLYANMTCFKKKGGLTMKGLLLLTFAWLVVIIFDYVTHWNFFESFVIVILSFLLFEVTEAKNN